MNTLKLASFLHKDKRIKFIPKESIMIQSYKSFASSPERFEYELSSSIKKIKADFQKAKEYPQNASNFEDIP